MFLEKKPDTSIDDLRIVKRSTLPFDFLKRGVEPARGSVWPMRRHCLDDIGDRQYSCAWQNLIAFEPSWIARAIDALMVLPYEFSNGPGEVNALEDVVAGLAVLLQHPVFQST